MKPILEVKNLSKKFEKEFLFKDLSFSLFPMKTLALVGRSGSGKSTLGKILMKLENSNGGSIYFQGKELACYTQKKLAKDMQIVFQNPYTSLNPSMKVKKILKEPLVIHEKFQTMDEILTILDALFLAPDYLEKYPHQLSGGEKQRVALGRSLILHPKVLILDEILSSLDEKNQQLILKLLQQLQEKYSTSYLFITHNMTHAREFADDLLSLDSACLKISPSLKTITHT